MAKIRFVPAASRRDEWLDNDPVPLAGEICIETDTGFWKFGDGLRPYSELPYAMAPRVEIINGQWAVDGANTGVSVRGQDLLAGMRKEGFPYVTYAEIFDALRESAEEQHSARVGALETEIPEKMIAVSHLLDDGKDLVVDGKKLYRTRFEVRESEPYLAYKEVGHALKDDYVTHTIAATASKVRLYFKASSTLPGNVLAYTVDEAIRLVIPVSDRTRQYSTVLELPEGASRELRILGFTVPTATVRIWDIDEKVVTE